MDATITRLPVIPPQPDITSEAVDDTFAVAFAAGRAFERVLILGTPSPRPSLRLVPGLTDSDRFTMTDAGVAAVLGQQR